MFKGLKRNEEGQVLVFVALLMFVLIGFTALIIYVGSLYSEKRGLQNAVDAAALAGAQELPNESSALTTAKEYAVLNDVKQSNATVTTHYNGDSTKIEVVGTKTVKHYFAQALGFTRSNISARAVAQRSSTGGTSNPAFDYVIFSGNKYPDPQSFSVRLQNDFRMTASSNTVEGNIHGNYNLDTYGNEIKGVASAVGTVDGSDISTKKPDAPFIEMPDFSSILPKIKADAIAAGQYYEGDFSSSNASSLNLTSPVYVEGNANLNGVSLSGNGTLYAGGKITTTGAGGNYQSENSISLYSGYKSARRSDYAIDFAGFGKDIKGMLYAPNGGITVTGSNYTFYGSVISRVVHVTGSNKIFQSADISDGFPYIAQEATVKLVE